MFPREKTRQITVGNLVMGGQNKVIVQSMCNTHTKDIEATIAQIKQLEACGCELIRVAVLDKEDALAIRKIRNNISIPLVADIHFDYHLAVLAAENGADKIRINPGNIGSKENVRAVVEACRKRNIPIRIGINSGSIEKQLLEKYGHCCPEAMIESAQKHIDILEELDFHDICLSFKSSDVRTTIEAYRLASRTWNYPLHLGVTEAGTKDYSLIKSSAALGTLLNDGIGDTIRVSISDDCREEIKAARRLLKAFDLIKGVPDLVSCPTCGRLQYDVLPIMHKTEEFLETVHADIKVAIMGCAVNGPGEAADADIGVAGGKNEGLLFRKGQIIRKVPQEDLFEVLKEEILKLEDEKSRN